MSYCKECRYYFPIPEDADDFEAGKGDCVREEKDDKGKYWLGKPTKSESSCDFYTKKIGG